MRSRPVVGLLGLPGISGFALQVTAARDRLREATLTVAQELETVLAGAASGDQRARGAALPCCVALAQDDGGEYLDELRSHAERAGLPITRAVLRSAAPHRAMSPRGRLTDWHASLALFVRAPRVVYHDDEGRRHAAQLTPSQAERMTRLCTPSMDKVLAEPDPARVKKLLSWEALRPGEVLRIASRRPTTAAIVRVLVANLRWAARRDIREALVLNPFTPTGIALKLLPTVSTPRQLLANAPLHPLIFAAAAALATVSGAQLVHHRAQRLHRRLGEADGARR